MTDPHDVLIVVPCLNEAAHIGELLAHLVADMPDALIVVADGGSVDRSRDLVAEAAATHPGIVLLDNPRRIQSAGINLAVSRYGYGRRWLVRIDAHCRYPEDYVSRLVAQAVTLDVASIVVPMRTIGSACFQRAAAAAQNSLLGTGGAPHRSVTIGKFVDHGHHALMRIDRFAEVGGYCEHFSQNEDAELDRRLALAGGQIWLEPSLAVIYFPRRTPLALFRQYKSYGRGRARTVQRHHIALKPRHFAPLAVLLAILLLLAVPLTPWAALPFFVWAAASIGYGLVLGVREASPCAALSGVAAMIMHCGWATGFAMQSLIGRPPGDAPAPLVFWSEDRRCHVGTRLAPAAQTSTNRFVDE